MCVITTNIQNLRARHFLGKEYVKVMLSYKVSQHHRSRPRGYAVDIYCGNFDGAHWDGWWSGGSDCVGMRCHVFLSLWTVRRVLLRERSFSGSPVFSIFISLDRFGLILISSSAPSLSCYSISVSVPTIVLSHLSLHLPVLSVCCSMCSCLCTLL